MKLKEFEVSIYDTIIAILTLFSMFGILFYFYCLIFPDTIHHDPFREFDNNPGIIKIYIFTFTFRLVFLISFGFLAIGRYTYVKKLVAIYLISAFTIGFLQWFELYYGSTFYYGEVRDKQGLMFPILSVLMATLIIWKYDYSIDYKRNLAIKLILTVLLNIALYFLWTIVYEPWFLYQS
jgi:hypothetical protein